MRNPLTCRVLGALCLTAALALPAGASAWKGMTHLYLAEEVREGVVAAGGLVSVDTTSFWGQQIAGAGAMGSYAANEATYSALVNYPAYYRAGALGPDAYPDLLFGQNTIHPNANAFGGTDAWLKLLYANANTPQERAFVMGFMAHAAADIFGHTYVNTYAGGPFELGPNAARHVLVESYIANRTPPLRATSYSIETSAVEPFIFSTMIDARRGRDGSPTVLWELTRKTRYQTVPGLFTELREGLEDNIAGYYDHVASVRRDINDAWDRCKDSFFLNVVACGEAAALELYLDGIYRTFEGGVVIAYEEAWRDDINRGLRAWPATSTAIARAVFTNPVGADWNAAGAAFSAWKDAHLLSMIGLPDVVAEIINAVGEIVDLLGPLNYPIEQLKRYAFNWVIENATGKSLDEWKRLAKGEATDVDQWVPSPTGIRTSEQLNRHMALSGGVFTAARFAPALNSMAMIKLSLINDGDDWLALLGRLGWRPSPGELRQLLQHRHYDAAFPYEPMPRTASMGFDRYSFDPHPASAGFPQDLLTVMFGLVGFGYPGQQQPNYQAVIGFIRSIDESNQWEPRGDGQQFILTRDYNLFMRLFVHQLGDCHDEGRCARNPLPAIQSVLDLLLD